jgi:hypothetical protein
MIIHHYLFQLLFTCFTINHLLIFKELPKIKFSNQMITIMFYQAQSMIFNQEDIQTLQEEDIENENYIEMEEMEEMKEDEWYSNMISLLNETEASLHYIGIHLNDLKIHFENIIFPPNQSF